MARDPAEDIDRGLLRPTLQANASTVDALRDWFAHRNPGARDVAIHVVARPPGGFSSETTIFDAQWRADGSIRRERYVLRRTVAGRDLYYGRDLWLQCSMMESLAARTRVPVPAILWKEHDASFLGSPFFVMSYVEGRVPTNGLPGHHGEGWLLELTPDERARVAEHSLAALAGIHRTDWDTGFEFLTGAAGDGTPFDRYVDWVAAWCRWALAGRPNPVLHAAVDHVLRHRPPPDTPLGVVWGDARFGNLLVADDLTIAAVLDWELAGIGPAEVDLAYWLIYEEIRTEAVGLDPSPGMPDRAATIARYEHFLGRPVDDLRYYEILAWLRFTITNVRLTAPGGHESLEFMAGSFWVRRLTAFLDDAR